jgi:8-oxo-dGTP diphosphatase
MFDPFGRKGKRPTVAADIVVFAKKDKKLHVLLIKRGMPPYKGKWCLPGGFMEWGETCEETAARELFEETALKPPRLRQIGAFSRHGRDPRGTVVSVAFMTVLKSGKNKLKAGDDAAEADWFPLSGLPPLGFDHQEIIAAAQAAARAFAFAATRAKVRGCKKAFAK